MPSFISGVVCALGLSSSVAAVAYGDSVSKSAIEKQFSQEFSDGYSILKHYGGNGPYSERRSYGISRDPPDSCAVDQVIMIKRHGERFPSPSMGELIEASLAKIYGAGISKWEGDLTFLDDWTYFVPDSCWYNAETYSGPYAGLLDGYQHGVDYRDRYGSLWNDKSIVPIFSSGYSRVINTARKFGEGFFGYNYSTNAALNIISESASMGANSLTPTCDTDNDTATCDNLPTTMPQFKIAAARLNSQNTGLNLTESDVYNLMCKYPNAWLIGNRVHTNIIPSHGILRAQCSRVLRLDQRLHSGRVGLLRLHQRLELLLLLWVSKNQKTLLKRYHNNFLSRPGDKNMAAVGAVYANASLSLLNEGPEKAGPLFFNLYALYPLYSLP